MVGRTPPSAAGPWPACRVRRGVTLDQLLPWVTERRKGYFLSRTEYLFSTDISFDAASGILAPLPRICLLVQRLP